MMKVQLFFAAMAALTFSYSQAATVLTLHRTFQINQTKHLEAAIHRDYARRDQHIVGVFNLSGEISFARIYYTTIALGSPPQKFNVLIDTGSHRLWVNCASCTNCPRVTSLPINLNFFDASTSTTAVPCSHHKHCSFDIDYEDGSTSSGGLITDLLQLPQFGNVLPNPSFPVTFGCSTSVTGLLAKPYNVDGILGLGQGGESVVNQLYSQRFTPNVVSHCLKGGDIGGGVLVIGEIVHRDMVYSPLVPHETAYKLQLLKIVVGEEFLPIPSTDFTTEVCEDVIIDSGTTLAYLKEEVYEAFVTAINSHVSKKAKPYQKDLPWCYQSARSGIEMFPKVTLVFAPDARMVLRPEDYLVQGFGSDTRDWCLGFLKAGDDGISILGDLVLRDRIVVYDSYKQQMRWSPHLNCSSPISINKTYGFNNDGYYDSPHHNLLIPILLVTTIILIGIL